ncbi:MAG: hypothetical protein PHE79_03330 [Eubacteriales bacterium]|nr:hypothetical protein [Eubacteriales bacterium]
MVVKIVIAVLLVIVYKFVLNFTRRVEIQNYSIRYTDWLVSHKHDPELVSKVPRIKALVRAAGISEIYIPHLHNFGFGQGATYKVNIFDTMPTNDADYAYNIISALEKATGVFRQRMFDALNPLRWIEAIVFLPRTIFEYLGVSADNLLVKLLNLAWWIAVPAAVFLRDQIYASVSAFLNLP